MKILAKSAVCRKSGLGLTRFGEEVVPLINEFLFQEACRLEQIGALMAKAEQFMKERKILRPSDDTLQRMIGSQKRAAREFIFKKTVVSLSPSLQKSLDSLLDLRDKRISDFHLLKQSPGRPSPPAMLNLIEKIEMIQATGVLDIDLTWLSNNFQRALTRYTKHCDAHKMRELEPDRRYSALVCFLVQTFRDTMDFMVDMYDKLINKIYNHAQDDIDNHNKSQRKRIRESLSTFRTMAELTLDETIEDAVLRKELFKQVGKEKLTNQMAEVDTWLNGKHSHIFNLVKDRFSYIRQFSPAFLKHLHLFSESGGEAN